MTTLEHLARTIAKARHGTDAMWANYMESAKAVEKMMSGWQIVGPEEKDALVLKLMERVRSLEAELRREREFTGGAAATYYLGNLVLCHPDMPPHIWDGEKMEKIEWTK